ncbi:MAG: efflux RND transporter permease subunit [Candidatus Sericytochromatia bacterium]|nr:efflux RND transporter permease subunit [Candidatus Sericytochromatia bacterium]
MIDSLIALALRQRLYVLLVVFLVAAWGVQSVSTLPIDAFPDVTNNQVQVLTEAKGLAPVEVEKLVTAPIEVAMQGLPNVVETRSTSKFALSVVTIVFADSVNPYFARQLVFERLQQARSQFPAGLAEPALGPMTSGMGEIYLYTLESREKQDGMDLRTLQDWVIKPQLRTIPGVTEVNSFGGAVKQIQALIEPDRLVSYKLSLHQVLEALAQTSSVAGGNYIEHNKEQYIVRGLGLAENLDDVRNTVITTRHGVPIFVRDIAEVKLGPEVRQGAVTADGKGEVVSGIVMMLRGENSRNIIERVKDKVAIVNESLPDGVTIKPYYDQTDLVHKTIRTVETNLLEGGLLVVGVLFFFLRDLKAALLVAVTIPLSMLVAFIGMAWFNLSANLMSLGAIDFGLIVDGSVVMIENAMRRLSLPENAAKSRLQIVRESAQEVGTPIFFGVLIIILVYLPILTLQGMEGKMFTPMALTVGFALIGSLLLALTLVPVLASWLLPRRSGVAEAPGMDWLAAFYERALRRVMAHRSATLLTAGAIFLASLTLLPFLGTEFLPEMDEGAIIIQAIRLPSVSLTESLVTQQQIERAIREFPEVATVVSRTGRPEIASDPMGVNLTDTFVMLKPRDAWTLPSKAALEEALRQRLAQIPGVNYNFTQPIAMRVDELVSGVKSDVAVKLFGEDLDVLNATANRIASVLKTVPGAREVNVEQTEGQTYLNIRINRAALARYGSSVAHVQELIEAAIGGRSVGELIEGQRRFDIVVKLPEAKRGSLEAIENLLIDTPEGGMVPLSQVATIVMEEGPAQVSREDSQRRIVVEANVADRDIGSFVAEAKRAIRKQVQIPANYFPQWGGQFENQERAMARLTIVVPLSILMIFCLLYTAFRSLKLASLVLMILPLATGGGIAALWLRGLHLSVSAAVGFIALFGIAVLNGIVLVSTINRLRAGGMPAGEAAYEGAVTRLRPVLMTALVASLGFVPMAISTGAGAEVQRPLATVVIGGLITATLLTLFVLPTVYGWLIRQATVLPGDGDGDAPTAEPE